MSIFHDAARDGNIDILREATRRDCDKPDEDGMTPVLWASYHGNVEALRILTMRGGNPDKCDYLGNSALHLASGNGHISCVNYLVSFGCNIWNLDNDFHTPLDIAGLNDRLDIVKYLDTISATQSVRNRKLVKKFKEKAVLEAQKRIKRYSKLQAKAQKKALREDKLLAEEREKMMVDTSPHSAPASMYSTLRSEKFAKMSISSRKTVHSEPKPYSAHFTINTAAGKKLIGGNVAKKVKERQENLNGTMRSSFKVREIEGDGTQTIKSISGYQRDCHIMYASKDDRNLSGKSIKSSHVDDVIYMNGRNKDTLSRAISEPDLNNINEDSGVESGDSNGAGLFERPGFGTVAFMNRRMISGGLMSLQWNEGQEETEDENETKPITNGHTPEDPDTTPTVNGKSSFKSKSKSKGSNARSFRRKNSFTDSIGTLGSLAVRIADVPWDESDLDLLDDDELEESTPLELFLSSNGLTEFFTMFAKEKIDLDAVLLLNDNDLKDLGLPLGPRRKLLQAIARRKDSLNIPGAIMDTKL